MGFFMDLTNIDGIERLEGITVFIEVACKLSGNLHLLCTQPWKGKKKICNVTVKNYLNESLLSRLCFIMTVKNCLNESLLSRLCFIIYGQGSFEKALM